MKPDPTRSQETHGVILRTGIVPRSDALSCAFVVALLTLSLFQLNGRAQTWTLTSAPTGWWKSIATSADGTRLAAVKEGDLSGDLIYASTNSGANWNLMSAPDKWWGQLASSADGTILMALGRDYMLVTNGNDIYYFVTTSRMYVSTNSGTSWANTSSRPTEDAWTHAASSADGRKWVATTSGRKIYSSTNAGSSWTFRSAPSKSWSSIASSADGISLVAVVLGEGIYTSADSGATWILTSAPGGLGLSRVASSADGFKLMAAANGGGPICVSQDAGTNWVTTSAPTNQWNSVACSADGSTLVAVARFISVANQVGPVGISRDSGATWTTTNVPDADWNSVVSSADGNRLFATIEAFFGGVCTLQFAAAPLLSISAAGSDTPISWTIPSVDFVLQENSDLTTTNWADVTITPTVTNYQNQVAFPPPAGNRFFRLKSL